MSTPDGAPLFSVLTPVYNTDAAILEAAIASVMAQSFESWELILVDDHSTDPRVSETLGKAAEADDRVRVIRRGENGGIVASSNDALRAANGRFVALLDHDDMLVPEALATMAVAIKSDDRADYLYSDEDKVDESGRRFAPFRKPPWSPERFRHQMYTCHLSVLRTELARRVGGFRNGFDGSQDHDLVFRVTERARSIIHVPEILYHWRTVPGSAAQSSEAKPYAWTAGLRAVEEHLRRSDIPAVADYGPYPGYYTVTRHASALPTVSLIIPTRGGSGLVWGEERVFVVEAVRSALAKTRLDPEVVVVYDGETPSAVLDELHEVCGARLVLVEFNDEFNFSAKCNLGFAHSTGQALVLMNDDVQAIADGWLEELLGPLTEQDVGMTGAKLLFSDGTIQHGGHVYANGPGHAFYGQPDSAGVGFGALILNREVSGVTGACAAVRREVFEEVGGLFVGLPLNFNDVDLSYKISRAGYRIVFVAGARLYHFESRTRIARVEAWETDALYARWGKQVVDQFTR